ncbi:MAG: hypothetical protein GY828_03745 [Candidatus Gracilibacteria bacterium]|nr:hypothetical protein [Candidatus Gracilibacteria bacterium]
MFILGMFSLSVLFIPLFFIYKTIIEKTTIGKLANIIAIPSLSTLALGILFQVQNYPGKGILLILGILATLPTVVLFLISALKSKKEVDIS